VSFVTGHDFSRAETGVKKERALAPAMAIPSRNASPGNVLNPSRTFFTTSKTSMGRRLLQSERNAQLMIDVLRSLVAERKFELHDFVVMPDHVHFLLTVADEMTIEKAMHLVKGRFSHRLSHELGYKGEVWQRGFSEVQVIGSESFEKHREYIAQNPVKAGLASAINEYPFCYRHLASLKAASKSAKEALQGLKPAG
jgi:putative transposase